MEIKIIDGTKHLAAAKNLIIEYTKFLARDLSFQNLDSELSDLTKKYSPPAGRLLCAQIDTGKIIGCVAYHRLNAERCEMKRLFVSEKFRHLRAGVLLVEKILDAAKNDGYKEIVLDTIKPLQSAIRLYKKFGFVEIPPYYQNPMHDVIYMKKIF